MKRYIATSLAVAGFILSSILFFGSTVSAATTSTTTVGQALEIAPPILTLSANPGQTINAQILLRDISSGNLLVSNQINDFVAAGENGTPKIIIGNDTNNPFSMKNWITPLPSFELSPEQIKTLNIAINVPIHASPGGHYGVIRFSGLPPSLSSSGVSLQASIGVLVLLTVNGKLTDNLSLSQFSVTSGTSGSGKIFESTPLNFIIKTKNSGNVQEEPTGHITVTDMFNKAVATINVNIPPHNVLPDSTREFTAALNSTEIGNRHLFGLYHAKLQLSYGVNSHKTITSSLSFWVIPYKLIIGGLILIIVLFFILRYLIRRYNRLIIEKAGGSRPKGHRKSKKSHRSPPPIRPSSSPSISYRPSASQPPQKTAPRFSPKKKIDF